ncbi:MAG: tRNA (adenosine(37)-N6)-threonylcarbamoyltransferase complex dimerization subunit type 1 TsaB [Gemmatimonadota bacterium]
MILAIETATPRASVALLGGETVVGEVVLPGARQVSEALLPAVLSLTGGRPPARVAVSAGPGSFTGLRVGMSAAKGFCFGWGIPLVAVPTLHALALRFPLEGPTICPVLDARKKEVYAGLFRWEGGACLRLSPDMAVSPDALPARLPPGDILFCGDGVGPFGPLFRESLGGRAFFPAPGDQYPAASSVGRLAALLVRGGAETGCAATAVPAYIRASEAETKRAGAMN